MSRLPPFVVALLVAFPASGWCLNLVIKNQNTAYADSEVYFSFRDAPVTGTINGQPLVRDKVYPLTSLRSGLDLQEFVGGRIYFSLGTALTGTGDPEPINSSMANWGTRFDKIEMTYSQTDHSGVANLTAIDYFAIPLAIQTYTGNTADGSPRTTLTYQPPGDTIISNLAALTDDNSKVLLHNGAGQFLRVLGPTLAPAGVYPSFQPYLDATRAAGQITQIAGLYSRAGGTVATTTQQYQFSAAFDPARNLVLTGGGSSYAGGPSVGSNHMVVIQADALAAGIYSANPDYTVDGGAAHIGDNDVYAAVVRDILTGFALGFVNSATIDASTGIAFKDEPSDRWWSSPHAFGYLQSNPAYYDPYAAYLETISNAYGHPFSDRWQVVQASLDPATIGTMEIDVLPDVARATSAPVLTSRTSATATEGTAFSYQMAATNHPTSYGVQGLPGGLTVNASTGLLSGTPKTAGTYKLTLNAYNTAGRGSELLTLTIAAAPPTIRSTTTASGTVGKAFSYQITATNAPTSYGVQGLPGGLTINASTGLISGKPKVAGTFSLTLNAYNNVGRGSAALSLTITN